MNKNEQSLESTIEKAIMLLASNGIITQSSTMRAWFQLEIFKSKKNIAKLRGDTTIIRRSHAKRHQTISSIEANI